MYSGLSLSHRRQPLGRCVSCFVLIFHILTSVKEIYSTPSFFCFPCFSPSMTNVLLWSKISFVLTSEFCLFYLTLIYKQEELNSNVFDVIFEVYKYKNKMYFSKQCQLLKWNAVATVNCTVTHHWIICICMKKVQNQNCCPTKFCVSTKM